jgi:hypothetical protein
MHHKFCGLHDGRRITGEKLTTMPLTVCVVNNQGEEILVPKVHPRLHRRVPNAQQAPNARDRCRAISMRVHRLLAGAGV